MSEELPKPHVVPVDPSVDEAATAHLRGGGGNLRPLAVAEGGTGDLLAPAPLAPAQGQPPVESAGAPGPVAEPVVPAPAVPAPAVPAPLAQVPPPPERDPAWHRPVFVLAPARSNSSVVSSMIGSHPELYGFPELSLFRGSLVSDLIEDRPGSRGLPQRARSAGLARAIAQLHEGRQDEETIGRARQWLRERAAWGVADVFDHLLALVAPATGLEKSPENSNREDYLERLAKAYPRARFIHLTRHPVTTARSMHEAWHGKGFWDIPDDRFHLHVLGTWLFNHGRIKRFTSMLPPDRWIRVRSEDLLNEPAVHLPPICRWLGIDPGPEAVEAMTHPERSPFARIGPSNALGGNDPKFLEAPGVRRAELPTTLDLPPEWPVDPWFHVAVIEFAASIGYRHEPG